MIGLNALLNPATGAAIPELDQETRELQYMMRIVSIGVSKLVIIGVGAKVTVLSNLFGERMKGFAQDVVFERMVNRVDELVLSAALVL